MMNLKKMYEWLTNKEVQTLLRIVAGDNVQYEMVKQRTITIRCMLYEISNKTMTNREAQPERQLWPADLQVV